MSTNFSSLNGEIQDKIWTHLCNQPRTIVIGYYANQGTEDWTFKSTIPTPLQVSRRSRARAKKYYKLFFPSAGPEEANMYFNSLIDICYVLLLNEVQGSEQIGFVTAQLSSIGVQHMAIDFSHFQEIHLNTEDSEMDSAYEIARFLVHLPSVKTFALVLHGDHLVCDSPAHIGKDVKLLTSVSSADDTMAFVLGRLEWNISAFPDTLGCSLTPMPAYQAWRSVVQQLPHVWASIFDDLQYCVRFEPPPCLLLARWAS